MNDKCISPVWIFLLMILIGFPGVTSIALDNTTTPDKLEAIIQASYKKEGNHKTASVKVTAKRKDGKVILPANLLINFYVPDQKEQKFLNKAITDEKGYASIELPENLPLDETRFFTITAKIENDRVYQNAEDKIHCKEVNLSLRFNPADTSRLVTAKVTEKDGAGKEIPVKAVEIKFYVQRLFGTLPAKEDHAVTTDENGEASFNYPDDIAGDFSGNIILICQIEDNDQYGNVEFKTNAKWGIPLIVEKDPFPRALWEPTAPLQLILTFSFLFSGIWFIYFFIFTQLFKIKKETKFNLK